MSSNTAMQTPSLRNHGDWAFNRPTFGWVDGSRWFIDEDGACPGAAISEEGTEFNFEVGTSVGGAPHGAVPPFPRLDEWSTTFPALAFSDLISCTCPWGSRCEWSGGWWWVLECGLAASILATIQVIPVTDSSVYVVSLLALFCLISDVLRRSIYLSEHVGWPSWLAFDPGTSSPAPCPNNEKKNHHSHRDREADPLLYGTERRGLLYLSSFDITRDREREREGGRRNGAGVFLLCWSTGQQK